MANYLQKYSQKKLKIAFFNRFLKNFRFKMSPPGTPVGPGEKNAKIKGGTASLLFMKCVRLEDLTLTEERLSLSLSIRSSSPA